MGLSATLFIATFITVTSQVIASPAKSDSFHFQDEVETIFTLETEKQILPSNDDLKALAAADVTVKVQLESGKLFQGDIKLVQEQKDYFLVNDGSVPPRTGWIDEHYRWPKDSKGKVIVPYYIDPASDFGEIKKPVSPLNK